jgi:uncharacterized protein YqfB (UPF0267 family)
MKEPKKEKLKRVVTFSEPSENSQNNNNIKLLSRQITDIINELNPNLDFKSSEKYKLNSLEKVIKNLYNNNVIIYIGFNFIKIIVNRKQRNFTKRIKQ